MREVEKTLNGELRRCEVEEPDKIAEEPEDARQHYKDIKQI